LQVSKQRWRKEIHCTKPIH